MLFWCIYFNCSIFPLMKAVSKHYVCPDADFNLFTFSERGLALFNCIPDCTRMISGLQCSFRMICEGKLSLPL